MPWSVTLGITTPTPIRLPHNLRKRHIFDFLQAPHKVPTTSETRAGPKTKSDVYKPLAFVAVDVHRIAQRHVLWYVCLVVFEEFPLRDAVCQGLDRASIGV